MEKKALEANNIVKYFGPVKALDKVSLSVLQGESLGLVGESGSGKTTLARVILGLIPYDEGQVYINNVRADYHEMSRIRKEFQIVFQDPQTSLNPRIRIGEAIAEPILIHKLMEKDKAQARVIELLELVGLKAGYRERWPHELSGGERQRVNIARALATAPKVLILDEPVSSLDVVVQLMILNLLKELRQKLDLTYLFIAHDLNVVGYMCDRITVMRAGKVVEVGQKEAIFRSPQEQYTKELLLSSPRF